MRAASPIAERPISQTGILFCHTLFSITIWLIENIELFWEAITFEWCFVYEKRYTFHVYSMFIQFYINAVA